MVENIIENISPATAYPKLKSVKEKQSKGKSLFSRNSILIDIYFLLSVFFTTFYVIFGLFTPYVYYFIIIITLFIIEIAQTITGRSRSQTLLILRFLINIVIALIIISKQL